MTDVISSAPATPVARPAMPSITASALRESWLLLARTRRVVASWLATHSAS